MKSFLVLGLGRFGTSIATTLEELGHEVFAVDTNEHIVNEMANKVTHVVQADVASEDFLKSIGVKNFYAAIVAIGDDIESSITATLLLKELGSSLVISKAQNEVHAKLLYKVGADRVVFPERDMGIREANSLTSGNIVEAIELSPDFSIIETSIPDNWVGKSISTLRIRSRYNVSIIALRKGNDLDILPHANTVFSNNDLIAVMGKNDDLDKLRKLR